MRAIQPTETVASGLKLSASGSAQPKTSYVHELSSVLAEGAYVDEAESVQPRKTLTHEPAR